MDPGQYPVDSMGVPQHAPPSGFNVASLIHWMIYGKQPGAGLNAVPSQLWQAFNPSHPAGAANLLSMFAGGGDFTGAGDMPMENPGLPGRYEPYSLPKAQASGQVRFNEGQPHDVRDALQRNAALRQRQAQPQGVDNLPHMQSHMAEQTTAHAQAAHDAMFGGEVHAKGSIPVRPTREAVLRSIAQMRAHNR